MRKVAVGKVVAGHRTVPVVRHHERRSCMKGDPIGANAEASFDPAGVWYRLDYTALSSHDPKTTLSHAVSQKSRARSEQEIPRRIKINSVQACPAGGSRENP